VIDYLGFAGELLVAWVGDAAAVRRIVVKKIGLIGRE
jgi:hypothetical protein